MTSEQNMKNVKDLLKKVSCLNYLSEKAKRDDEKLKKHITSRIIPTKEGFETETTFDDDRKDFMTLAKEAIGYSKYEVKFKKLDERAVIPTYAHDGDVGMDLTAIDVEYNEEIDCYIYHTGLAFETDKHYGIFLFPRSSNRKTDAYLANHVGVADSATYRGEIMLCFKNRTSLKQHALEKKVIEYFNLIEVGVEPLQAAKKSIKAWLEPFKNPMKYAPYKVGDKVAQMITLPHPYIELTERVELSNTERGDGGFGSSDKKQ